MKLEISHSVIMPINQYNQFLNCLALTTKHNHIYIQKLINSISITMYTYVEYIYIYMSATIVLTKTANNINDF